jgi:hypothetical protein
MFSALSPTGFHGKNKMTGLKQYRMAVKAVLKLKNIQTDFKFIFSF